MISFRYKIYERLYSPVSLPCCSLVVLDACEEVFLNPLLDRLKVLKILDLVHHPPPYYKLTKLKQKSFEFVNPPPSPL